MYKIFFLLMVVASCNEKTEIEKPVAIIGFYYQGSNDLRVSKFDTARRIRLIRPSGILLLEYSIDNGKTWKSEETH